MRLRRRSQVEQEAIVLLRRAFNYLPDNSSIDAAVREFLRSHDEAWFGSYEEGRRAPLISRLWKEGELDGFG